jgi:hypothetical protein
MARMLHLQDISHVDLWQQQRLFVVQLLTLQTSRICLHIQSALSPQVLYNAVNSNACQLCNNSVRYAGPAGGNCRPLW